MHKSISLAAKRLEDAFFEENDRKLIAELHILQKMEESIESLSKVSGITKKEVLKKLIELNIRPETIAAIAMVPIVEVAWADGSLDSKEKAAILSISENHLGSEHQIAKDLLTEWLNIKPPKEMLEAWLHYVDGLCENLSAEEKASFKQSFMENAYAVADASGGFLGMGNKISKKEQEILKILDSAFS
jgi:tellurite resistance protein